MRRHLAMDARVNNLNESPPFSHDEFQHGTAAAGERQTGGSPAPLETGRTAPARRPDRAALQVAVQVIPARFLIRRPPARNRTAPRAAPPLIVARYNAPHRPADGRFTTAMSPPMSMQPSQTAAVPARIHLDRERSLTIHWNDGRRSVYPLDYLRSHCPCASCREQRDRPRAVGLSLPILPQNHQSRAQAVTASLVGRYALQIVWADGHDTGIYDFRYLREIDPGAGDQADAPARGPSIT